MNSVTVTKRFEFEASHHLPHYEGACHNVHGHSYKLDVTVGGTLITKETHPKVGMIMDFKDLKSLVEEVVLNKYDHADLNAYFDNPTAEIMVEQIAHDLIPRIPYNAWLVSCKLWETSTSYAEWHMGGC